MRVNVEGVPLDRLRARLEDDGDPPIHFDRDGDELVFSADTAPIMLRARVIVALEDAGR